MLATAAISLSAGLSNGKSLVQIARKVGGDLVIASGAVENAALVNQANKVGVIDPYLGYFRCVQILHNVFTIASVYKFLHIFGIWQ